MLTFWLIAAVLILLAVGAVVIPLLRSAPSKNTDSGDQVNVLVFKDQLAELEADVESGVLSADQFEQGRLDLERRLLEETSERPDKGQTQRPAQKRWQAALFVGLCVPALALFIYTELGRVELVNSSPHGTASEAPHSDSDMAMGQTIQALANRLAAEPNDSQGWLMLGRSYKAIEEYQKSADAFRRARELVGDHPELLVAYADARLMASNGRYDAETAALIERALEVDPNHVKALWLAGTVAYQQGDYAKSLATWERLAALAPEGSELANTMASNIAESRALLENAKAQ